MTSRLSKVKRGISHDPLRFVFYSEPGLGKSTLAAHALSPIFLDVEDGTGRLDVARYTFRDDPSGHIPSSLADVLFAIDDLRKADHSFRSLVIDTADRVESLIWQHVVDTYSGKRDDSFNKSGRRFDSIDALPFGKGFAVALDQWRILCARLDDLRRDREMQIIILGHAHVRTFKNPAGDDFDRYQLRINEKAAGFLREWCDVVGFCAFEEVAAKPLGDDSGRAKGHSTGRRVIHFERSAVFDAKTRIPLPREVELAASDPWGALAAAINEGRDATPEQLRTRINIEVERIGDLDLRTKVESAVDDAGDDTAKLSTYLNELRSRESAAEERAA